MLKIMSFKVLLKGEEEKVVVVEKITKDHKHLSGREFTEEEFKNFGWVKITPKKTTKKILPKKK